MPVVFERPVELQRPEVAGVFVGGCVARGDGSSFRHTAHSHTEGTHKGWICVRAARRLSERVLMLHELAHILTGEGHTDKWRAKLLELGGTLEGLEIKRPRGTLWNCRVGYHGLCFGKGWYGGRANHRCRCQCHS